MCILIENELIYLAIPKTGCISITNAIVNSNLNYELAPKLEKEYHRLKETKNSEFIIKTFHYNLNELKKLFGDKKTISIRRNHLDRFISALKYVYYQFEKKKIKPKVDITKINNDYIFKLVDDEFIFLLENSKFEELLKYFSDDTSLKKDDLGFLYTFISSSFMKCGYEIDYEFDISEIHSLQDFLNKKYKSNIEIKNLNSNNINMDGIIKNNELSNFIWDKFERKYQEKKFI